jgi:hypothetical protein
MVLEYQAQKGTIAANKAARAARIAALPAMRLSQV